MSSVYPNNLDTFQDKVDGVTEILADDVNELQYSVVALENFIGKNPVGGRTPLLTRIGQSIGLDGSIINSVIKPAMLDASQTYTVAGLSISSLIADKVILTNANPTLGQPVVGRSYSSTPYNGNDFVVRDTNGSFSANTISVATSINTVSSPAPSIYATDIYGTLATASQPNITSVGTLSALTVTAKIIGSINGSCDGNAGSVTNGVYTNGSYSDPSWITSLAGTKISGNISGNAGSVTNGVYTNGSYSDPSWITSLAGTKISGNISGNAATATNATYATSAGSATTATNATYATNAGSASFLSGFGVNWYSGTITSDYMTISIAGMGLDWSRIYAVTWMAVDDTTGKYEFAPYTGSAGRYLKIEVSSTNIELHSTSFNGHQHKVMIWYR